jgi:P4 family phage/plasmid primase-like protien
MEKLNSKITNGSGISANLKQPPATPELADPVFQRYGLPFLVDHRNRVVLNDRAVAVKCAAMHMVKFDASTKTYERFDSKRGLWIVVNEVAIARTLDNLLLELGARYGHQDVVARISAAKLDSLCRMMRSHDVRVVPVTTAGLVHVRNGVVDLGDARPRLLAHDPTYRFRAGGEIVFDAKAKCPKFLTKFLGTALEKADIQLLQKYAGSMLLGPNTCHGIMVIRGTPGGGKSTLVSIIEKVIGENYVAHLRTAHLGGRFETSAFLGKRLLVGKDVPGDTLAVSGARMLKSLVGDDLIQAEIKYNADKQPMRGDFHVVIVSNNNLRIALDGDQDAWGRRLLVVDYKNPKPAQPIPNLAEKLVAAESSGILNWLIEGALAYRAEMDKHGQLRLTQAQRGRIATLLEDSDNVTEFVKEAIVPKSGYDVTSEELLLSYYRTCERHKWTPVGMQTFYTRLPDLLAQMFKTTRRNDIQREGKAVRGFKNIALV